MTTLKDILYKVHITSTSGSTDVEVTSICFDSRKVQSGSLFVAIKGTQSDGHAFIDRAISAGAIAVVAEKLPDVISDKIRCSHQK